MNKIFSIPLNPRMDQEMFFNEFLPFLSKYKDWIYDIYFTCRIAPFTQDAMGELVEGQSKDIVLDNAFQIQEKLGIKISATFNNINVSPSYSNYKLFIDNLKPLYERGLRGITLAHAHWVALGIKKYFPELEIKNTILRKVATGQDFIYNAEQGFDYINVDRILMRDIEELKNIKRAQDYFLDKTGKLVKIALLTNEGCLGRCPMMDEHYSYNNLRGKNDLPYFRHEISKVTCEYKWENTINAFFFKAATIPPFKDDYDEYLKHIQVFKMHGRDNISRMRETMEIIRNYANDKALLADSSKLYIEGVPHEQVRGWRNKIKKCKFQCWDCNYCDIVADHKKKQLGLK